VDNTLLYFAVDGVSFFIDSAVATSCGRDWNTPCTLSFNDTSLAAGQVLAVEGDDIIIRAAGTYCSVSGMAMTCSSTHPASAWNSVKSDFSWKSWSNMTRLVGTSWAAKSFNDSTWVAPNASTSSFHCNSCGLNGAGQSLSKIWG
jgi:hypothetical protein